jgi:serine/threonine protein kinase
VLKEEPCIPDDLSRDAADFISKLLVKDPEKRLGAGEDGVEELKRHPFFKGMDWCDLAQRKYSPSYVPSDTSEPSGVEVCDGLNQMNPTDLPPDFQNKFRGYSYGSLSVPNIEYLVSDESAHLTAESCRDSAEHISYQYTRTIEYLMKKLNEAQHLQMRSDIENMRLESDLKAAVKGIGSLEKQILNVKRENKKCGAEKKRLKRDLVGARKKIVYLEGDLNGAICLCKRYNDVQAMLELQLRAALNRIKSLEALMFVTKRTPERCS